MYDAINKYCDKICEIFETYYEDKLPMEQDEYFTKTISFWVKNKNFRILSKDKKVVITYNNHYQQYGPLRRKKNHYHYKTSVSIKLGDSEEYNPERDFSCPKFQDIICMYGKEILTELPQAIQARIAQDVIDEKEWLKKALRERKIEQQQEDRCAEKIMGWL